MVSDKIPSMSPEAKYFRRSDFYEEDKYLTVVQGKLRDVLRGPNPITDMVLFGALVDVYAAATALDIENSLMPGEHGYSWSESTGENVFVGENGEVFTLFVDRFEGNEYYPRVEEVRYSGGEVKYVLSREQSGKITTTRKIGNGPELPYQITDDERLVLIKDLHAGAEDLL